MTRAWRHRQVYADWLQQRGWDYDCRDVLITGCARRGNRFWCLT